MYNHDIAGTRANLAEEQLSPADVGGLKVKWTFPTKAVVAGTPAVVDNRVYAVDATGTVYALRRDGTLIWSSQVAGPTTASLLVTRDTILFGDIAGNIYGVDVKTGAKRWSVRPNAHPTASIFSSPTPVGNDVAIGIASLEELVAGQNPGYKPSFRGSVVLLDPETGQVIWQTYTITAAESAAGASGAGVWSTPACDPGSHTIYVSTGNNYSEPTSAMSDALIALDAHDGHVKWVNQFNKDDAWNFSFPPTSADDVDFDFGDSPKLYLVDGRLVVGAGQKSGFYHVADAATGATVNVNQIQVEHGGQLSGLFATGAEANGLVFANTSYWPNGFTGGLPVSGGLAAIAGNGMKELWKYTTPLPNLSGVAEANNVVYFQSIDGTFYALDARNGSLLAEVHTGGQSSGPSVSHGQIYLGIGNAFALIGDPQHPPPGVIMALGIDGGEDDASDGPDLSGIATPPGHADTPGAVRESPEIAAAGINWVPPRPEQPGTDTTVPGAGGDSGFSGPPATWAQSTVLAEPGQTSLNPVAPSPVSRRFLGENGKAAGAWLQNGGRLDSLFADWGTDRRDRD
jgi:polyvinyl alcohol dehydrogenase (cytochrome)